jgi:hypothetical protein
MSKGREVRVMANEQNLRPSEYKLSQEEAKKGGKKSAEARRARKTLKETLLMMLEEGDTQNNITLALLDKALKGDTKAYEVIRDTVGEKPTDKIEQSGELNNTITVKFNGEVEEWGK